MQATDLLELRDDLNRESRRLKQLVDGLFELEQRLSNSGETVEAAAPNMDMAGSRHHRLSKMTDIDRQGDQGQHPPNG